MDASVHTVIALLYGLPLLVLASSVSFVQLSFLLRTFSHFAKSKGKSGAWKAVQAPLKNLSGILDSAFPSNFQPTANHVLLGAVAIAVLLASVFITSALAVPARAEAADTKVAKKKAEQAQSASKN
jgi:hypothetical protein